MNNEISLDKAILNKKYVITKILLDEHILQKLYNLGIVEDTQIIKVYKSPFNDPVSYFVRGAYVAIRNNDASKIIVRGIYE